MYGGLVKSHFIDKNTETWGRGLWTTECSTLPFLLPGWHLGLQGIAPIFIHQDGEVDRVLETWWRNIIIKVYYLHRGMSKGAGL